MQQGRLRTLGALVIIAASVSFGTGRAMAQSKLVSGKLAGVVRDLTGVPQMGAMVDILGTALHTFRVFTDDKGYFAAAGLPPGNYSVKVSAPAFLPTLREKINVKAGAGILLNLTLTTLFDAVQFTPRNANTDNGDWDWVLRSTANRPVLRIMPDGSPVVVAKANDPSSNLKGTLSFLAGSSSQGFGSLSDLSTGFSVEKSFFASDNVLYSLRITNSFYKGYIN